MNQHKVQWTHRPATMTSKDRLILMANRTYAPRTRPGVIIVLTAISLVVIFSFVALAIDLSMKALARNQAQNAADAAAIAGARSLTGDPATGYNLAKVPPNGQAAAANNTIMGQAINPTTQVTITPGYYYYNQTTGTFIASTDPGAPPINITPAPPNTLVKADVTASSPSYFSRILGYTQLTAQASATAIHRPRDIVMVVDFSYSMGFDSLMGTPLTNSTGTATVARTQSQSGTTENPTMGHYSNTNIIKLQGTAPFQHYTGEIVGSNNLFATGPGGDPPIADDFYQDNTAFGSTTKAFTKNASPGGATYLPVKTNTTYIARNVNEAVGNPVSTDTLVANATFDNTSPSSTTAGYGSSFKNYIEGPGYWGKTFFMWPPDPRGSTIANDISVLE